MLDHLEAEKRPRIYPCAVRATLDSLDAIDKQRLQDAIQDEEKFSAWRLHRELQSVGLRVSDKAIKKHRDLTCSCRHLD